MKQGIGEMADGFEWYVSQDQERWFPCGDTTRAGAIEFGTDEFNGEGFYICEGARGDLDLRIPHFRLGEILELINEENMDPDGDGSILSLAPTKEQLAALEDGVEKAIRDWFAANGFKTTAWAFAKTRNEEYVPESRLYTTDDRYRYHALVASMGRAR
jgi:hypothetical protein